MYHFPAWKYWLVIIVMALGVLLALPTVFGEDPALQVARLDRQAMDAAAEQRVMGILKSKNVSLKGSRLEDSRLVLRFNSDEQQSAARDAIVAEAGKDYTAALSSTPAEPRWMAAIGLKPMGLGLDLQGGVNFLYEVDVQGAVRQAMERMERSVRTVLREKRIPYSAVVTERDVVRVTLRDADQLDAASEAIRKSEDGIVVTSANTDAGTVLSVQLTPDALKQRQAGAIEQNIVTLRNRVNELGVSEAVVQSQGKDRIVVQLPGVKDPNQAIRVLGATTTLEWHMVDEVNDPITAESTKRIPLGSRLTMYHGAPILLKREWIVTGSQMVNATSGASNNGLPAVNVTLNGSGGNAMLKNTQQNVSKRMAVLSIDKKRVQPGEVCNGTRNDNWCTQEQVISAATIQGVFSNKFIITGLTNSEASELALLLRAGSLDTPIDLVASSVVEPSLGKDNIEKGVKAFVVGLALTFGFMAIYYKAFGLVANAVLLSNMVLLTALLSVFNASMSMPGIAGLVLTVGMAADANILIYERIREELRLGNSPQASINAGFEKAFSAIADSNVTTLIAAVVLLALGSGPIRGFAVVLALGIVTSLFTAIIGSRALIHFIWGRRRMIERLSI